MLRYYGPADQFKESSSKVLNTSTKKHLFWNFAAYFVFIPGPRGKKLFVDYNYTQFFFSCLLQFKFCFRWVTQANFQKWFQGNDSCCQETFLLAFKSFKSWIFFETESENFEYWEEKKLYCAMNLHQFIFGSILLILLLVS